MRGIRRWFQGTFRPDKVETGAISDADDGQAWETLREAGYEKGDVIPLAMIGPATNQGSSTTSDTFQTTFSSLQHGHDWRAFADAGQVKVRGSAQVTTVDDTIFIRIRDVDNSETIVSPFSTDGGFRAVGSDSWEDYTPPNGPVRVRGQIRNTDNESTVETRNITLYIGVEI